MLSGSVSQIGVVVRVRWIHEIQGKILLSQLKLSVRASLHGRTAQRSQKQRNSSIHRKTRYVTPDWTKTCSGLQHLTIIVPYEWFCYSRIPMTPFSSIMYSSHRKTRTILELLAQVRERCCKTDAAGHRWVSVVLGSSCSQRSSSSIFRRAHSFPKPNDLKFQTLGISYSSFSQQKTSDPWGGPLDMLWRRIIRQSQ